MSDTFFSRGMITQGNMKFYMIGKVKDSITSSSTEFPNDNLNVEDKYYILCQNEYNNSNNKKQRLYWSSDLNDFVRDYNNVSLNQGPVEMLVNYNSGGVTFSYLTQKGNILSNNKKINNLTSIPFSITPGIENKAQNFTIVQSEYNINPNFLFYSIPYQFRPIQNNSANAKVTFPWCFRKTNTSSVSKINIFTTTIPSPAFTNKNLSGQAVHTANDIPYNDIDYTSDNRISISNVSNYKELDKFPEKNGVVYIINITKEENSIFYYTNKTYSSDTETVYFSGLVPNIYGSNPNGNFVYSSGYFGILDMQYSLSVELRNDINNFFNIKEGNDISKWMDIYLIPATENAYFSDVHTLSDYITTHEENERVFLNPLSSYEIYCPGTTHNINSSLSNTAPDSVYSFQHYFFSQFSTFFINYLLGGTKTYWKTSGYSAFPTIGKGSTLRGEEPDIMDTLFTWARVEEAKSGFMYSYCLGNEICGSCYGNNSNGSTECFVHHDTRKLAINHTTPGLLGASSPGGGTKQPLSHSNTRLDVSTEYYAFIGVNVGFFVILIIVLIVYAAKKSKSDAVTDMGNPIKDIQEMIKKNKKNEIKI